MTPGLRVLVRRANDVSTLLVRGGAGLRAHAITHPVRVPRRTASWVNPLSWRSGLGGEPGTGSMTAEDLEANARDEAAKTAILEKIMQGRQPAELMLRCARSALMLL
jgi:hypothetical protein